ncbi:uncharacterized protein N7459_002244 [Penicillium hispanicum]|uniref:uncharacterized protein n=1 Tax=Penicillium hispanicum TaxID=1080232 RepID=UPI00253FC236|nr:uncharacterized protein N7459_002244 [Penicillium hispanicum]KAJ5591875.1 hypothetical protein N7459_002244 [Penicillium hispanicum]
MFFLKEETKIISLHPSYFGPNMRDYLISRLNEEEEGRCTGDHFVICVMDMVDIGEGRVIPSSGNAEYTIKYRAIIWKPFRGETVDAIVTSVKPTGIFTLSGPLSVFIARKVWMTRMPQKNRPADSSKNIPSDIKWEPNTVPPQYTDHADQVIEKGTSLRLKILGVKPDVAAINAIGTIKEDYLGWVTFNMSNYYEKRSDANAKFSGRPL